jgi:starvation-inducible DNA-binding protein
MTLSVLKTDSNIKTQTNPMMETDLKDELGQLVLRILSGSYVLMLKTQAVHWNIAGPLFKSVHDLTEDQYQDLFAAIDDLAERIRALGLKAPMNYEAMKDRTDLEAFDHQTLDAGQMIAALAAGHELLATELAAGVKVASEKGDPATEDIFTERLRIHQKHAWMLRAMIAS